MKLFIYLVVAVVALIIVSLFANPVIESLALGVAGGIIVLLVDTIVSHLKWLRYMWWSIRYFNRTIRLSISYLYRIKIGDTYFLVRGQRIKNQFQPVGGVYKRLNNSDSLFMSIGALDDDLFPIDESSKNDLRIRIKGRHLLRFIRWFSSEEGRESSPWREFYEELVETEIVPGKMFPYLFTKKIKQHVSGICWSDYVQSLELFIADIYEPVLNEDQYAAISKLSENSSDKYVFATEEQVKRLGIIPKKNTSANISRTASWVI